jgi:hypothetical protein
MNRHVTTAALAALAIALGAGLRPSPLAAQEERQRRNLFGMHTLNSGNDDFGLEQMEWTRHLVGRGWVLRQLRGPLPLDHEGRVLDATVAEGPRSCRVEAARPCGCSRH